MLKISEVYEKQIRVHKERPDGSEYVSFEKVFDSRECLINTNYLVSASPHEFTSDSDLVRLEGAFPAGTQFTSLVMDGNSFRKSEVIVVGSFSKLCGELKEK